MATMEEKLIEATRRYLESKRGKKLRPSEILEEIIRDDAHIEEIATYARQNKMFSRFSDNTIVKAKRNLKNIHPRPVVALRLALNRWETAPVVKGQKVIEIPLHELLLEEQAYKARTNQKPLKSVDTLKKLLGIKMEYGPGVFRIYVPADKERELRKDIQRVVEIYEGMFERQKSRRRPLLEVALEAIGKDPKNITPEDLKELEEKIYDTRTYHGKLKDVLQKKEVITIQRMLDPRYNTPNHILQLARLAKEEDGTKNVVFPSKELQEYMRMLKELGFTGSAAASPLSPSDMRVVAGNVKRTNDHYVYINARPELARALLKHLARKNRKIQRFLELSGLEDKDKGKRKEQ